MSAVLPAVRSAVGIAVGRAVRRLRAVSNGIFSNAFVAAYPALTDVQNVAEEGTIMNVMPKGEGTATSTHAAPILFPDADGVHRSADVDEPAWNGARVDGGIAYSTDALGAALAEQPFAQANAATTNLYFPSVPDPTATITVPATEHILWIEGTGSITSSYGTATEAAPLIFTGTAAGVVFTTVGTVDIAQIQSGNIKIIYVPTTTVAASAPALEYTYDSLNIDPSDATINITYKSSGTDVVNMKVGSVNLLETVSGDLVLSDGVNSLTHAITAGIHDVVIELAPTYMALTVDGGTRQVAGYTPIAVGTITVAETFREFTINGLVPVTTLFSSEFTNEFN